MTKSGASIKYVHKNLGVFDPLLPPVHICPPWSSPLLKFLIDVLPEMSMARRSIVVAHTVGLNRISPLHVILSPLLGRVLLLPGRNGAVRGGPVLEHGGAPDEGLAADVAEVRRGLALVPPHVDLWIELRGMYTTCQIMQQI